MTRRYQLMQQAIAIEDAAAGLSIEWTLRGSPSDAWRLLSELDAKDAVVGIGAPLVQAVGASVPGLVAFSSLRAGSIAMPATQRHLWTFIPGATPSAVFETADRLARVLNRQFRIIDSTTLFRHKDGRDLSDYKDGSANPVADARWDAALIAEGETEGGSFALTQRYLHFRERFFDQSVSQRDQVIGRRHADDTEIADAPATAHVKRTEQESFEPPAFLLRRSMPWGDPRRNGLQFVAFMATLESASKMLARMIGTDGPPDALLAFTQAETGGYYYCPPQKDNRLKLPAATLTAASAEAAPPTAPGPSRVHLTLNGPYALEGNFSLCDKHLSRASLCRCGASKNPPFCDGAHSKIGFTDHSAPAPLDAPDVKSGARRVTIRPVADGPLAFSGPVELFNASGSLIARTDTPTLCRCGNSGNKPYCDGSHAQSGFCAPD